MKLVVFGLSLSSSCDANATFWRGLIEALARQGHKVDFYERAATNPPEPRARFDSPNCELTLYSEFETVRAEAAFALRDADVGIVTSQCLDALAATALVLNSALQVKAFYDIDASIALERLARGEVVEYLGPHGLSDFDVVLSGAGGPTLIDLQRVLRARRVAAFYPGADPSSLAATPAVDRYRADLSYLENYSKDRQSAVEELFFAPAVALPTATFVLGGTDYPNDVGLAVNVNHLGHIAPGEHASLYASARLNLQVSRAPLARRGYCPSSRLFEAAGCGAAMISDDWPGLDAFYSPDDELLVARDRADVIRALERSDHELQAMAARARERTLAQHTVEQRARELVNILAEAHSPSREFEREARERLVEI
jgi:spore maturation protein CgeB